MNGPLRLGDFYYRVACSPFNAPLYFSFFFLYYSFAYFHLWFSLSGTGHPCTMYSILARTGYSLSRRMYQHLSRSVWIWNDSSKRHRLEYIVHYKLTVCPRLGPRKKKTTTAGDLSFNHHRRERINSPEWTLSGPGAVRYQHRRFTHREKEKKERNHKTLFLFFFSKCSEDESDETGPADQYIWNWHDDFLVSQSELYHHLYFSPLSM